MGLGIPEMMAIGGGVGLLTGGLRGGVKGAALGGLGGAGAQALKGANFLQGASAVPTSASAFESSMGLAGLPGAGTIESAGLAFNPATGTYLAKDAYALGNTAYPIYKGGEGLLSNIGGGLLNGLPDYVTPQNVMGAANILSNIQPQQRQMPTAQGGGVRQGQTQGLNVPMGSAQLIRRRGQA